MAKSLVVRVEGNLDGLKKSMKEGEQVVQATSTQIEKLTKSFDGTRLITHANNVTAAIREVGVTTLTTSQASRNLDLLERAMDKMRRTSEPIPDTMKRTAEQLRFVARASDEATPAGHAVTAAYRQFDGVLQAVGINLGPYVKGVEDVANATGALTGGTGALTGALGLLGPALALVATAAASIKFGLYIGETTGWTNAIARHVAVLKGWGDLELEQQLARIDAMALAGKAEENQKRATKAAEDNAKAIKEQSDTTKENWRITEGNADALANLQRQLDAAGDKRKKDAMAAAAQTHEQWLHGDATKAETAAIIENTKALDAREESLKRIAAAAEDAKNKTDDFMKAATLNDRAATSVSTDLPALSGYALDNVINKYRQAGDQSQSQALQRALEQLESQEGRYKVVDNRTFNARQNDTALLAQLRLLQGSGKIPGFASGVENFSGGLAYVHKGEMLANLPAGTDVIPQNQMGGTTINLTLHVSAPFFGTVRELTESITKDIADVLRGQGYRFALEG